MDTDDLHEWFGKYLGAYSACGRGEAAVTTLLAYYGVPLLFITGDGCAALTTEDEILAACRRQADGMRAAGYHDSELLSWDVTHLNAASAHYRATLARRRADATEINRLVVTYLLTKGAAGPRISVLAVHDPPRES